MKKYIIPLSVIFIAVLFLLTRKYFDNLKPLNYITSNAVARDSIAIAGNIPSENAYLPIPGLELPYTEEISSIIAHTGFSLLYSEKHEQAQWVAYLLTTERAKKGAERSNKFKPDPKVSTQTANDNDYAGSGYDRGHLAPAADMSWSTEAMKESFYYSNMSPQVPGFNRGIWKKLEGQVRSWALRYDSLYVVTGPVLEKGLPSIGKNSVSVPKAYFKALLRYKTSSCQALGFILPNSSSGEPLQKYAVTIDSLEKITGTDFFYLLPNRIETEVESKICLECWDWKGNATTITN